MFKKILSSVVLQVCLILFFTACTGVTPDVELKTKNVTLDNLDWSIAIENAEGVKTYTLAEAQKHDLVRRMVTMTVYHRKDGLKTVDAAPLTFFIDGIPFKDFLSDIGKSDATSCTYYGSDINGKDMQYTMSIEEMNSESVVIGWIQNNVETVSDTLTYVGIFSATADLPDFVNCTSVNKIVIA